METSAGKRSSGLFGAGLKNEGVKWLLLMRSYPSWLRSVTLGRQPEIACGTCSSVARWRARSARRVGLLIYAFAIASFRLSAWANDPVTAKVALRSNAAANAPIGLICPLMLPLTFQGHGHTRAQTPAAS